MPKQYFDRELLCEVAKKLRETREGKGLSQYIVDMDIDTNTSRIERGKANITISTLSRLCKYYGVTLEEFFRGIDI
jgi:transcriptional regulator with XRE-family HTH domain